MKRFALPFLLLLAVTASAQQPTPASPTSDLQKQKEDLQLRQQFIYEKLHGITEFQIWLQLQDQAAKLDQQIQSVQQQQRSQARPRPSVPMLPTAGTGTAPTTAAAPTPVPAPAPAAAKSPAPAK